jgi:hypothetical protein
VNLVDGLSLNIFAYVGFVGTYDLLIDSLGGDRFCADLSQLAGVTVHLSSADRVGVASLNLQRLGEQLDRLTEESGSVSGVAVRHSGPSWPKLKAELLASAPADVGAASLRLAHISYARDSLTMIRDSFTQRERWGALSTADKAHIESISESLPEHASSASVQLQSLSASKDIVEPITRLDALEQIHALDKRGGIPGDPALPGSTAASGMRVLLSHGTLGRAAEALFLSDFHSIGKLKPVPLSLVNRRGGVHAAARAICWKAVGRSRRNVDREGEVRAVVDAAFLPKADFPTIVRLFGGASAEDVPLQAGIEQMGIPMAEAGTWGDISLAADILTAVQTWESVIWLIWGVAGGLAELGADGDAFARFGLAAGVRNMIGSRFPAPTIILMLEFVVGRVALDQWERRTVPGAPRPSWVREAQRMSQRQELQVYEVRQLVHHMMSKGLQPPVASTGAAASSATTTVGGPSPHKRNADGLTKYQAQVVAARVASGVKQADARSQVLNLAEADLLVEQKAVVAAAKKAKSNTPSPTKAKAATQQQQQQQQQSQPQQPWQQQQQQQQPPWQQQQQPWQQQQQQAWQQWPPQPSSQQSTQQWASQPPWQQQQQAVAPAQTTATAVAGGVVGGTPRETEPAAMARVAALIDSGQQQCIAVDIDAVRAYDTLVARAGLAPTPCAWRALYRAGHANCDPQRKCKCNRSGAAVYNPATEGPFGLQVKALIVLGSPAAQRLAV